MQTNGEFVSRVVNGLKALSKDGRISKRYVLFTGRDKARFLISQKYDEMTLFREEGIITTIPCLPMKKVSVKSCDIFEFRLCNKLMRSVCKLPSGIFGKNGSGIVSVTNLDNTEPYEYISPRAFSSISKRKHIKRDSRFFYTQNGYLYLPNASTELVELSMIALNKEEAVLASSCNKEENKCIDVWESEFVCPDRFFDLVVKDTINELASVWRTSLADTNPNMDENQKGKTV